MPRRATNLKAKVASSNVVLLVPKTLRQDWTDCMAIDHRLSHLEFHVACIIGAHFNNKHGSTFVGITRIAEFAGVKERAVMRAVQKIERYGYLIVQHGRGRGHSNVYRPAIDNQPATLASASTRLREMTERLAADLARKGVPGDTFSDAEKVSPHAIKGVPGDTLTHNYPTGSNSTHTREAIALKVMGDPGTRLCRALGADTFASWFGSIINVEVDGPTVRLLLKGPTAAKHIRENFGPQILDAWRAQHPKLTAVDVRAAKPRAS